LANNGAYSHIVRTNCTKVSVFCDGNKNTRITLMLFYIPAPCSANIYFKCKRILESNKGKREKESEQSYKSACLHVVRNNWSILLTLRRLVFQLA
jgi:hypothetical protein